MTPKGCKWLSEQLEFCFSAVNFSPYKFPLKKDGSPYKIETLHSEISVGQGVLVYCAILSVKIWSSKQGGHNVHLQHKNTIEVVLFILIKM